MLVTSMPDNNVIPSRTSRHGTSFPLGATIAPGGVNFSVFAKHATGVELLFFDRVDAATPRHAIDLHPRHQRSYTRHPNSRVAAATRGTYQGVIEKVPYLLDLGITAVELLPVFAFDDQDAPGGLNDWGYQPVSFFAPHPAYSSRPDALGALDEFRDMVKALHSAGIEVILDVVYNHTTEAGANGPTMCFRGFGNDTYYILDDEGASFADYSGCANTLNANQTIVRRLILDSLHYWVTEMYVDGFRFDLASILSRDESGRPMATPPLLWDIETDPPVVWHGVTLHEPDWGDDSHTLAATTRLMGNQAQLHIIANAYWEPLAFEIPPAGEGHDGWRRIIDTSLASPDDVRAWADAPTVADSTYVAQPRSVVLLITTLRDDQGRPESRRRATDSRPHLKERS
jgi:pullulanase/glycogen debranching enzyme